MRKIVDPFTDYLPHLDLHGETTATATYLIESFIRDNLKLKNSKIIIIHGKGSGALRSKTHELLKRNKSFDVERKNKYEYSKDISKLRLFQVLFSLEEDNLITHTNEEYGIIFKIKEGILYG